MGFNIRNYLPSDLQTLYQICLKTGKSGKDASGIYKDQMLLGHYYAAPYVLINPELSFVLTLDEIPIGYILGTDDSEFFFHKCEEQWFPKLRAEYPFPSPGDDSPDSKIIGLIYKGHLPKNELSAYPAHLHIDILPEGQGKGMGKKLLNTFINKLKDINVSALYLEVGKQNINAIKFYEKMEFHTVKEYEWSIAFGMRF